MATTTMTMATMEANSNGVTVSGEIRREGTRYVAVVDAQAVGSGGSLRSALEAMANGIRRRLPSGRADSWGVRVRCNTNVFGVAYGNLSGGGGGGGELDPCVAHALATYRENSLGHALEHGIATLARCCR
jgi:hypothetical protein